MWLVRYGVSALIRLNESITRLYPRALALAEAGWSMQKNRSWEGFILRMKPTLEDMMRRGITFSMEF